MSEIEIVTSDQADSLGAKVLAWAEKGWEPHGPVLTCDSQVGQLIVRPGLGGEYRLIVADSFTDLKRDMRSLEGDGFDLHSWPSYWNGKHFQWMVRYRLDLTGDVMSRSEYATTDGRKPLVSALEDIITPTGRFTFVDRIERVMTIPSILAGGKPLLVVGGRLVDGGQLAVESPSET